MKSKYSPPLEERAVEDLQKALVDMVCIYTRPNAWYAQQAWEFADDIRKELSRRPKLDDAQP